MWYIHSDPSATTNTHGSNEIRITVGHVWALEHYTETENVTATNYTFRDSTDGRHDDADTECGDT